MLMHRLFTLFSIALAIISSAVVASETSEYQSPQNVAGATTVDVQQAKQLFDKGVTFIDVRNPRLFQRKHIPNAHHLDLKEGFSEKALLDIISKEQPMVVYCSGTKCSRSSKAASLAISWGFTQVYYYRGGIIDWKAAGYPMVGTQITPSPGN
ncbi:MAG: rhodanese-like domain-containing protein [bacterium]